MPLPITHLRPVCYCHIVHQFYYPSNVVNGMSVCPYCDAYGAICSDDTYRPDAPQWHTLLNAVDVLKTGSQHAQEHP